MARKLSTAKTMNVLTTRSGRKITRRQFSKVSLPKGMKLIKVKIPAGTPFVKVLKSR